jgi:hypothetical protein
MMADDSRGVCIAAEGSVMAVTTVELRPPYLLFLGDVAAQTDAKTAPGIAHWRPQLCVGQLRLGSVIDTGLPDMSPGEAVAAGARSLVALSFAAVAIMAVSDLIKVHLIADHMPAFPTILIVTTLALVVAQFRFIGRLRGAFEVGNLSFYLFFCAVGAMIDVKKAILLAPVLFLYVMVMIVVHMVSVYGIGRLLRMDIRLLTIASAAAKTGPPSVVALANVHGWKHLVLPGVAMGLLGYAVGNYLGFATAQVVRVLLGS